MITEKYTAEETQYFYETHRLRLHEVQKENNLGPMSEGLKMLLLDFFMLGVEAERKLRGKERDY